MASAGASASSAAVESAVKASSNSSASSLKSPGSVAFSSQPVAPVVVNSHARRQSSDSSPSWSSSSKSGSAAATSAAPAASVDADEESNNKARGMRHPQQTHSRGSGSTSGGGGGRSRENTAPSSPYNSSSDQSETSDEERVSSKSAVHAKSSAGISKEGQQQQQQARKSSGSSVASLPAISGAALLQLRGGGMNSIQPADKRGDEQYEGGNSAGGTVSGSGAGGVSRQYRNRSRSRSRERPEPITGRWSISNNNNDSGANPADKDVNMGGRPEDRSSFSGSSEDREMRIMFHGREIYADDLIGLRVAKTFVGHGRFLGQVVKFDEPTSLYTVVYADGDAEELNIDNTIQILIQDEIERADPSLPPVSSAYAKEVYPSHPDSPEITGAKSSGSSSQQQRPQGPPSSAAPVQGPVAVVPTAPPAQVAAASAGPGSRASLQISEREAQFVVGLFENHALPVLLREGWKIQTSQSGSEQRFYAPQGNFPGAGRVFSSALAVVELIASDNELLSVCFPQNVHSAILSLFPESSRLRESSTNQTRKRVPVAQVEAESYDMKRQRPGRDEVGGGPPTSHMRPVPSGRGPPPPAQSSSQRHSNIMDQQRSYHHQSSEDIVMEREREAYAADRVLPVSSERFGGGSTSSREGGRHGGMRPGGGYPEAGEYRRAPPNDSRGGPPMRGLPQEGPGSRWSSGGGGGSSRSSPAPNSTNPDLTEYRRQYADSPEWRERELHPRGEGGSSQHYSSGPSPSSYREGGHFRGHSRSEEPPYYAKRSAPPPRMRAAVGGDVPPGPYRYREIHSSPTRRSPSVDHFHRRGPTPPTADVGPPSSSRRESVPPEYRNVSAGGERMGRGGRPPPPGRGDPGSLVPPPGVPPGRGPSFSMMDVDRNSNPRTGGVPSSATTLMEHSRAVASDNGQSSKWESRRSTAEHGGYEQSSERGRSPHINEPPSQTYGGSQHHQHQHHHQRHHSSHHHHQRMPSNGDSSSYMETNGSSVPGGRAPSADLTPEQQQRSASPGALSSK